MARPTRPALTLHTPWQAAADPATPDDDTSRSVLEASARAYDAVARDAALEREAPILLAAARAITLRRRGLDNFVHAGAAARRRHGCPDPLSPSPG